MKLPAIGDVINDRYRLDARLGDGGFGSVFSAVDSQRRTQVALKILHPDDGEGYRTETRRRFEREVAVLMQVDNPHTVRLLGYGTSDGLLYLVFELLPGRDLADILQHGPLPPPVVEHILRQVLASLADTHRAGLLHRDIKPANVRIMQQGDDAFFAKLMDFGIARSVERDRQAVTKTGELIGTPRYMAPEQLREAEATAASDIYSLGVVAVEMLGGPGVLGEGSLGAQLERLRDDFVFPLPSAGDPRLNHVVRAMTAVHARHRLRTAGQVLEALDGRNAVAQLTDERATPVGLIAVTITLVALVISVLAFVLIEPEPAPPPPKLPPMVDNVGALLKRDVGAPPAHSPKPDLPPLQTRECNKLVFRGMGVIEGSPVDGSIFAYLPTNLDAYESVPLVMLLHGFYDRPGSDRMNQWLDRSGLPELAEKEGFAILAPVDVEAQFADPWQEPEDVARLRRWRQLAVDNLCIDETRIYIIGQSEASYLNNFLRCESWVTALAHNGSRTFVPRLTECDAPVLPSVWVVPRDTDRLPRVGGSRCTQAILPGDIVVPYGKKRGNAPPHTQFREQLIEHHGCELPGKHVYQDEGTGLCFEWECEIPLRFCAHGGGEPWPGTTTVDPCAGEATDFPVGEQIWTFFESVEPLKLD